MIPFTAADTAILTAPNVTVDFGAELLDANDVVVADLSPDLIGGKVDRNNYADVHGTCSIDLLRALDWPSARVRLWQAVASTGAASRFNLGVFVLTTPDQAFGDDPATYSVQGYDKLHLLQPAVGDTRVIATGTGYLAAVTALITAAGVTGLPPLFDMTAQAKVLPTPMVWVLDDHTWLGIINDLLAAIGYRGLWVDNDGRFRSEPYQAPSTRPPEWVLDLGNQRTNIVGEDRTYSADVFDALNWWRFIREGMAVRPTEGFGLYTVDRSAGGVKRPKVVRVTAADQAALVIQGDKQVAEDAQSTATWSISTGPLPVLGHFDVMTLTDPVAGSFKVMTRSHSIPLDGGDVTLVLEVI